LTSPRDGEAAIFAIDYFYSVRVLISFSIVNSQRWMEGKILLKKSNK